MDIMSRPCNAFVFAAMAAWIVLSASGVQAGDPGLAAMAGRARSCGVSSGMVDQVESWADEGLFSEKDAVSLLSPVVAACSEKLPLAPFEDKLAEGLAKRVSPSVIARALGRKLDEYLFAGGLLQASGHGNDPKALVVLGEGLSKGVPRQDFADYVSSYGEQAPEPFLTGMEMTSLLSQAGFDYGLTRSMLDASSGPGGLSPDWRYFIRIVLVARQRGLSDAAIAEAARDVVIESGSPADVSTRLGFTIRDMTGRNVSD